MEDWIDHDETIFENKFEYTQPLLKELYKGMLKWDKRRRMNMIFIYVLLGINIAMNIVFIIIGNYDLFKLLLISLGLLAAVVIFRALEPVILSRSVMNSYQKKYSEPMDVYTTFDEDYMTTHDVSLGATAQRALSYDSISSVHESEHFIVLRLDKRQVMSILKTGFIKGNVDDFRVFIMRKIHEAEEGYENVDIDTGDVEEDRDGEPVYTAPQDVENVLGDVDGAKTEDSAQHLSDAEELTEPKEEFTEFAEGFTESKEECTESAEGFTEAKEEFTESAEGFTEPKEEFTEPAEGFTESKEEFTEPVEVNSKNRKKRSSQFSDELDAVKDVSAKIDAEDTAAEPDEDYEEADPYKAIDAFRKKDNN